MDIVIAVARDVDDTLSSFYVGYDFSAGKAALVLLYCVLALGVSLICSAMRFIKSQNAEIFLQ